MKQSISQKMARQKNIEKARKKWQSMSKEERSSRMPKTEALKKSRIKNMAIAREKRWPK
jgi:hypothetical protein